MWSYHRNVLNDFVCAAREFYINSAIPPRKTDLMQDSVCTTAFTPWNIPPTLLLSLVHF
jgi:hypothetical protein